MCIRQGHGLWIRKAFQFVNLRRFCSIVIRYLINTLLQVRVLGLGLLQDGDLAVGVFPERQEILIRGTSFGGVALRVTQRWDTPEYSYNFPVAYQESTGTGVKLLNSVLVTILSQLRSGRG